MYTVAEDKLTTHINCMGLAAKYFNIFFLFFITRIVKENQKNLKHVIVLICLTFVLIMHIYTIIFHVCLHKFLKTFRLSDVICDHVISYSTKVIVRKKIYCVIQVVLNIRQIYNTSQH
jgi:hypothetical protein